MKQRTNRGPSGRINTASSSARNDSSPFSPVSKMHSNREGVSARLHTLTSARSSNQGLGSTRGEGSMASGRSTLSKSSARNIASARESSRSETDLLDQPTKVILDRLRLKEENEKRAKLDREAADLGDYNPYSRPRASLVNPHRSVFLDPSVNNFSPSRTRTELLQRVKAAGIPHQSYDLDGDGYVSQDDYRLAKRFDFDGNGVIDPRERKVAKHVIADEFFKKHKDHIHVFGPDIANATHEQRVKAVENSVSFERTMCLLKEVENSLRGRSSAEILSCMETADKESLKKNFFMDRSQTTAWTNFDSMPRSARTAAGSHNGSRNRLFESRRLQNRAVCSEKLQSALDAEPKYSTQRSSLITNPANW